jgi:hypothetical protein
MLQIVTCVFIGNIGVLKLLHLMVYMSGVDEPPCVDSAFRTMREGQAQ